MATVSLHFRWWGASIQGAMKLAGRMEVDRDVGGLGRAHISQLGSVTVLCLPVWELGGPQGSARVLEATVPTQTWGEARLAGDTSWEEGKHWGVCKKLGYSCPQGGTQLRTWDGCQTGLS